MVLARSLAEGTRAPKRHVFIPSGVDNYMPRREDYDPEVVLRDPTEHLALTWAEVYFQFPFSLPFKL